MVRVYMPAAASLAVLYLLLAGPDQRISVRVIGGLALAGVVGICLYGLYTRMHGADKQRQKLEAALCSQPQDRLWVTWGNSAFPFQILYRPGREARPRCDLHLYSLGSLELAPFAVNQVQQRTGAPDLVSALLQGNEIYVFAEPYRLQMLQGYLATHYKTGLVWQERLQFLHLSMYALHAGGPPLPAKPEPAATQDDKGN